MKIHVDKKYLGWGITLFLVVCCSMIFYYLLFHLSRFTDGIEAFLKIVTPIIDGMILAYLMTPIMNRFEKKIILPIYEHFDWLKRPKAKKHVRVISITLTVIFVLAVVSLFFRLIIPQLVASIQSIIFQFPIYINNLNNVISNLVEDNPDVEILVNNFLGNYSEKVTEYLQTDLLPQVNELIKTLSSSVISVLKALWNLIIGFIISVYLISSKERFAGQAKKITYAIFETPNANRIIRGFRFAHKTFIGFVGGKIIDSIIIGILTFICTSIIGTPYSVLVSCIVGVTNVIPFFGPYIGAIPSFLLILMVNPIHAVYFLILILVIQQFDGNILGPKILGDSTGLSGFWVIFSITLFGGLFGVTGMIFGVPLFAVIYALIRYLVNKSLKRRNYPTDTAIYETLGEIRHGEFRVYEPQKHRSIVRKLLNRGKEPISAEDERDLAFAPDQDEEILNPGTNGNLSESNKSGETLDHSEAVDPSEILDPSNPSDPLDTSGE